MDFTIAFPCRNRINLANEAIALMIKHSDYPIKIVDDHSNQPDGEYLKHDRVVVTYNTKKQGLTALFNQCIKLSSTEYVILGCDKIRVQPQDFAIIEQKLREGFACVATYMLGFFGFSKHLTTKIGFFDEGFTAGGFEDTDWMNKLFVEDLALYFSKETGYKQVGSGWTSGSNAAHYHSIWRETPDEIIQLSNHYHDKDLYHGVYSELEYLPWSRSELKSDNVIKYFGGKIPRKAADE